MTQLHCWRVFIAHFLLSRFHNGFKEYLRLYWKDLTVHFSSFWCLIEKQISCEIIKKLKMCLQNDYGPIVGSTLPRKKNLCASFARKKNQESAGAQEKKNQESAAATSSATFMWKSDFSWHRLSNRAFFECLFHRLIVRLFRHRALHYSIYIEKKILATSYMAIVFQVSINNLIYFPSTHCAEFELICNCKSICIDKQWASFIV